jgi:hypothetical protein
MAPHRFAAAAAAAALAAALAAPARAESDDEHRMLPGQVAFGTVGEADEVDAIRVFLVAGSKFTFQVKARKGEALLPSVAGVLDTADDPVDVSALVKANAKGTVVTLKKFVASTTGVHTVLVTGADGTTGIYDLKTSAAPSSLVPGSGSIDAPGEQDGIEVPASPGTELLVQVKAAKGSALQPLIQRFEDPDGANLDLGAAVRTTTKKKDQVKKLILAKGGPHLLVVTGAAETTGGYTVLVKPGRKVALDLTVDPEGGDPDPDPDPAPTVTSVAPTTAQVPESGSESRNLTVTGTGFVDGATVAITAPSGTNGISSVSATFNSSTSLSVTYTLASTATPGSRTVTVTNPDLQSGAKASAFTVTAAASGITVTAVVPSSGSGEGGDAVLIQGTEFGTAPAVFFGGQPARSVERVDAQSILCTVPPAIALSTTAGTAVDVTVDNGGGDAATLVDGWTYEVDPIAPTILATLPAEAATGVATNLRRYVFVLSGRADASTLVTGNFDFFASGGTQVTSPRVKSIASGGGGRLVVVALGATTVGGTSISASTLHISQISDSVQDIAGNPLDTAPFTPTVYQGTFTTGATADTTAPAVTGTTPATAAINVPVDTTVVVTFGEPVDPSTVAGAVTLVAGGNPVPADLVIHDSCTAVTILPRTTLTPATLHSITVASTIRDLSDNALSAFTTATFVTAASDTVAPTAAITVDAVPQDMNGSTTFAMGLSGGVSPGNAAFNLQLPRSGFTLEVSFADIGGSGVDPSTFSCTCDRAMGGTGAGAELAGFFVVTPQGATWKVGAAQALGTVANATFTVNASDYAGNAATATVLQFDSASITGTPTGKSGDRDPFNARQSWLLRFDQDLYAITSASTASNLGQHDNDILVSSTAGANGIPDFEEDLKLLGLNGANASLNTAVQNLVKAAVRGRMNERYGIAYDGTRDTDSPDIEFLLAGEQGSLASVPNPATWTSGSGYSMMSFTGDESANSSSAAIGRALLDFRNTGQENDSNSAASGGSNLGTFGTHMIRKRINDHKLLTFAATFDPFIATASRGGTVIGLHAEDATVLGASFDYASASAPQKLRYDAIALAVDRLALYLSVVGAHEVGHSTGLVPDGPPPTGLFGDAHQNNTFIASQARTSPGHIDTPGPNIMEAASGFDEAIATGSDFTLFGPLNRAYLLRRIVYDQ